MQNDHCCKDRLVIFSFLLLVNSSWLIRFTCLYAWCFVYPQEISFNDVANLDAASVNGKGKCTETSASEVVNANACPVSPALIFSPLWSKTFIFYFIEKFYEPFCTPFSADLLFGFVSRPLEQDGKYKYHVVLPPSVTDTDCKFWSTI